MGLFPSKRPGSSRPILCINSRKAKQKGKRVVVSVVFRSFTERSLTSQNRTMKRGLKITGIVAGTLLLLIIAAAIIIPVAFKDRIKARVEAGLNDRLTAKVSFGGYRLSLFRAFPNASFTMNDLSVTGMGEFDGDTLAAVKSLGIIINLKSLFGDKGYEIKSVIIDQPLVNAIVTSEGKANWDIMKETPEQVEDTAAVEQPSSMKVALNKFNISDGRIYYTDMQSGMAAAIEELDFSLSGKMNAARTDLVMDLNAGSVDLIMDRISYLTDANVGFKAEIDALTDSMKFTLRDNRFNINDIILNLSGTVAMPDDDIDLDLIFSAPETSFKSLLSLVPAFYMKEFEELKATGNFTLDGAVKGTYSPTDSTLPDIAAKLSVTDGMISYPSLPEKITAINIKADVQTDGKEMDNTTVDVSRFHFELAGNPFDMSLKLATPISDPSVNATARGKIDLAKLQQAIPLDSISLNGLIDVSLEIAGRMSMIENKEYEKFRAAGNLNVSDMAVAMADMPDLKISKAALAFTPAFAELTSLKATMGKGSDFTLSGKLENYIPYLFSDGTVRGKLSLISEQIDMNEIMDYVPADTLETDTVPMEVIRIPSDIDVAFDARVGSLNYGLLRARDIAGNIVVRDGVVTASETGMKALGGSLLVNVAYDTRDILKPVLDADMVISSVKIREAFDAFNTVRQLMPAAAGLGGNVSAKIDFSSLLGSGMMPLLSTLSGTGEVRSESLQIVESGIFDKIKSLLKIDPAYTNIIKDLKATFIINDGRIYVKPFDTKLGNIKLNVSGDQGLDRTINYLVRTEIPRAELGAAAGALMSTFAAQASALGFAASPPDVIRVNLNVGGTVRNPSIIPSFAGGTVASMAASVADTVKQEVVEKVNEAARQQADRILKEAEEKAQMLRDEAAKSAAVIRSEADLRGKKMVQDAEAQGPIALAAARRAAEVLNREAEKRATQIVTEANSRADKMMADAKAKADELLK